MTSDLVKRFFGDGNFGRQGGGIPLPDAFEAVLQELLDFGGCSATRLGRIVKEKLSFKEAFITSPYKWGSWDAFRDDVLEVLQENHLAVQVDGRWMLGDTFIPGEYFEVLPGVKVKIIPKAERQAREAISRAHIRLWEIHAALQQAGQLNEPRRVLLDALIKAVEWDEATEPARDITAPTIPVAEPVPVQRTRRAERPPMDERPPKPQTAEEIEAAFGPPRFPVGPQMQCRKCGILKDKTEENYEIYWYGKHRNWYMRHECEQCRHGGRRRVRPGDDRPPRPETSEEIYEYFRDQYNLPGLTMVCHACEEDRPLTKYDVYWNAAQNSWYMRRKCTPCRNAAKVEWDRLRRGV